MTLLEMGGMKRVAWMKWIPYWIDLVHLSCSGLEGRRERPGSGLDELAGELLLLQ